MKSLLPLFFISLSAMASTDLPADYRQKIYPVDNPLVLDYSFSPGSSGHASLKVINYPNMQSDLFFFHMHANETTSLQAGEDSVRTHGGTFMYLDHVDHNRRMTVTLNGHKYNFDPNRIFTEAGLMADTQPRLTKVDHDELVKFVDWLKRNITLGIAQRSHPMVTALHNNTDDDTQGKLLSILTEKDLLTIDNQSVNQNTAWDIDNFYIATWASDYDLFVKNVNPNISLRLPKPRDIGYLANWMINENIEYLNVETQQGDLTHNLDMVATIQSLFP